MKVLKIGLALAVILIIALIYLQNLPQQIVLKIKKYELFCEIADTPEARAKGLMYRESMGENEGMFFKYYEEEEHTFHMANCKFPIAIAFADKNGIIVSIIEMSLEPNKTYPSLKPAMFAVEMNQGWFAKRGIQVGDKIEGVHQQYRKTN